MSGPPLPRRPPSKTSASVSPAPRAALAGQANALPFGLAAMDAHLFWEVSMLGYREIVTVVPLSEQPDAALQVTGWLTRRLESHVHFIHSQKEIGAGIGIPAEAEADIRRLQSLMEEGRKRREAERTEVRATVENWKARVGRDAELTLHTAPPGAGKYCSTMSFAIDSHGLTAGSRQTMSKPMTTGCFSPGSASRAVR